MQKLWIRQTQRNLVCVDSYDNGILLGRLSRAGQSGVAFHSLSQFLLQMEELLDENRLPQSYTTTRRFSEVPESESRNQSSPVGQKGRLATFELHVLFRQHTSWQGILQWKEAGKEESFRSVLELILLMDSALRSVQSNPEENHRQY